LNDPFTPDQRKKITQAQRLCQSCRERLDVARKIGLPNETLEAQLTNAEQVINRSVELMEEYRQQTGKG
jgi:hypothetical protein